jgi:2'-5' RNA ligase
MPAGNDGKSVRVFLALWPGETVRSRLIDTLDALKPAVSGKWVKRDNLHMTLAFLGDVDAARLPEISRIGAETAGAKFTLVLDRAEFWPRNGIVCLAGQTPPALKGLAEGLTHRLAEAGFAMETRPYRAHLTLARKGRSDRTPITLPEPVVWRVDSFSLVESRLSREGSTYILRGTWLLQDPKAIPESRSVR